MMANLTNPKNFIFSEVEIEIAENEGKDLSFLFFCDNNIYKIIWKSKLYESLDLNFTKQKGIL